MAGPMWKRGHFGWEYKGKGKSLVEALRQLRQYAPALENPLLIVCRSDVVEIHTNAPTRPRPCIACC